MSAGGLISYGTDFTEAHRQVGIYAGRSPTGATPVDLPVVQPTEFEMVINVTIATTLGVTIASSLLRHADHVME